MSGFIHILRRGVELSLMPFDALPPWLGLTLVSIITGVILLFIVRFTTPQKWVEITRARMSSAVYETRLFLDSPRRVFIAQGRLLVWSVAYIATMVPAFVIIALPLGLLYLHLDARHGLAPLPTHTPIVLRAEAGEVAPEALSLGELPAGVKATAAPVRARMLEGSRLYQRLVIERAGSYEVAVRAGDHTVTKRLVAAPGAVMSPVRTRDTSALLMDITAEAPIPAEASLSHIVVTHPPRHDSWLLMPWWLYWLLVATAAALALKKPLGVAL